MAEPDHAGAPPALANNVETVANVALILAEGADWFRELGTAGSPGTIVCTVSGATNRHGFAEVELGTPLATLSVILGDWQHLPHFSSDPELLAEVSEMQVQIERCKSIVSGILLSAGEARGDSSAKTTVSEFLQELVDEWRATRPVSAFTYENRFGDDVLMVDDSAIEQMICNVLDNALEASPRWLRLDAAREGDALTLTVTDAGPGFAPGMLSQFGKPYQSTKGRPGAGLGLFLVVNVARTIGGTVEAHNRSEGGAIVKITLPLAAIALEEEPAHGH
jgi:two-component system sensor histidine kinase RegB